MRIQRELVDNEMFLDVVLTKDEAQAILENYLLAEEVKLFGKKINLGISLTLDELDDSEEFEEG